MGEVPAAKMDDAHYMVLCAGLIFRKNEMTKCRNQRRANFSGSAGRLRKRAMLNSFMPMRALTAAMVVLIVVSISSASESLPLVRSTHSGLWSESDTWEGGTIPTAGARVQMRPETLARTNLAEAMLRIAMGQPVPDLSWNSGEVHFQADGRVTWAPSP